MDHIKALWWICVAGLSGAITSISIHRDKKTPTEIGVFIVSGMLTATFVAPLIAKWMGLEGQEAISAVGFLTGACWNSVITKAMSYFNNVKIPGDNSTTGDNK